MDKDDTIIIIRIALENDLKYFLRDYVFKDSYNSDIVDRRIKKIDEVMKYLEDNLS